MKRLYSLLAICISLIITFNAPIVSHAAGRYLFVDVPDDHWAFEAIKNAGEKEWFSGYPDGTFLPDATISRAEAAKVLVSFLRIDAAKTGYSSFYDVDTSAWYAPYVEAGKDLFPSFDGHPTMFNPHAPATREDVIYALVRSVKLAELVTYVSQDILDKYTDSSVMSEKMKPYVAIALQTYLISGYSDMTIRPKNSLTRAEFAMLLSRALILKNKEDKTKLSSVPDVKPKEVEEREEEVANLFSNVDIDYQVHVIELVNEIRTSKGLSALEANNMLIKTAQTKADDMADNNYFDHISPTYGTPSDMLREFGITYRRCSGENIAKGQQTPEDVVDSWMNSEKHKANILNPSYREIGVGYADGQNIWVQMFIG